MEYIGKFAFEYCDSLESISFPATLKIIDDYAFNGCNLKEIVLPKSLETISDKCFQFCPITHVLLPDCLKYIGDKAFDLEAKNIDCGNNPAFMIKDDSLLHKEDDGGITCVLPERTIYYNLLSGEKHISENVYAAMNRLAGGIFRKSHSWYDYSVNNSMEAAKAAVYMSGWVRGSGINWENKNIVPSDIIADIIDILQNETGEDAFIFEADAASFVLQNDGRFEVPDLKKFYLFMKERKASAFKLLENNSSFQKLLKEGTWQDYDAYGTSPEIQTSEEAIVKKHWKEVNPNALIRVGKLHLTPVHYKNGQLCSQQAINFVFASYAGQLKQNVITCTVEEYKTYNLSLCFDANADRVQSSMDQEEFSALLERFLFFMGYKVTEKKSVECHGSLILPYARYGSEKQIQRLVTASNALSPRKKGERGLIMLIRNAMYLSDTKSALLKTSKTGNDEDLRYYAKLRGTDIETLRDERLVDFGLDETGHKIYDLGNKKIEAYLNQDMKISLYDLERAQTIKTLPKKGADPDLYVAAKADISEIRKNAKMVVTDRKHILLRAFLNLQNWWYPDHWQKTYMKNYILHSLASLTVWCQNQVTFTLKGDSIIRSDGSPYALNNDVISVAHPVEMVPADLTRWQEYFISNNLKQPFVQIWENVHKLEDIKSDRYAGMEISSYYVRNAEEHGIHFHDEDFNYRYFTADDMQIKNSCIREVGHIIPENERVQLGEVSISRITRKNNHILYLLDMWTLKDSIKRDEAFDSSLLHGFTIQQVMELINMANNSHANSSLAVLLDYKNKTFKEYDPMQEFILE